MNDGVPDVSDGVLDVFVEVQNVSDGVPDVNDGVQNVSDGLADVSGHVPGRSQRGFGRRRWGSERV